MDLKALADATSKFTEDSQVQEMSTLSSDLIRSSDSVKFIGSKPPSSNSDSSMLDELSDEENDWFCLFTTSLLYV